MAGTLEHGRRRNPFSALMWGAAACLLALPWVAMRFTTEVDWTAFDFVVFGAMLLVACGTYEIATRMSGNATYRLAAAIAVAAGFFLVWVNLAVGVIGSENNAENLLFAGVLAVGFVGASLARFKPRGMARALVATAIAQALVAVYALAVGSLEGTALSVCYVGAWLVSAWLFRRSARDTD